MPETIGRFRILRQLGRGSQSVVFLARDPQLERDVAIKLVRSRPGGSAQNFALLHEARTVSKLRHDCIVSIFEAGEHEGQLYLVFEYVPGRTLAEVIRQEGALPAARAAQITVGILAALEQAHAAGIIHRDLKPSNVLIGEDGRPRVMDFGIAARLAASGPDPEAPLLGTPAYMAPEYITHQTINAQTDLFAAGLVLFELVFGRRAITGESTFQALHQIANEPLVFPPDALARIDEGLHDIIAKATVREPALRYQSAQEMRLALERYLKPGSDVEGAGTEAGQSTLDFLLRRMRHKSDFPAMSAAISAINRLAVSDRSNVNALSGAILKDFALTNKLLRLANSAFYPQFNGGRVSTVSRAIVILGFDAVRNLAISLLLFEHLRDKKHAELLQNEFMRANFAALLARDLCIESPQAPSEEAYICALFHRLGRMLAFYYFREEAEAIDKLVANEGASEEDAARRVLGISYPDLGIGIARSWSFPESIVQCMRPLLPGKVAVPANAEEQLRCLSALAGDAAAAVEEKPPEQREAELKRIGARFAPAIPLPEGALAVHVQSSTQALQELSRVLGISLKQTRLGQRLSKNGAARTAEAPLPGHLAEDDSHPGGESGMTPEEQAQERHAILTAGIQDISHALVEDFALGDLLRIVLETIYRAVPVQRVLLCMRDARSGVMSARAGLGAEVDEMLQHFRFDTRGTDFFNLVLKRDVDVLISDANEDKIARHLPEWFVKHVHAPTFLVFPLRIRDTTVAMIYADAKQAGELILSEKELSLLRTLRNQAVLAIKQAA